TNEPTLTALVVDEQDRRGVALFHQHHITVFLFEAHLEERKSASTRHSDVEGESGLSPVRRANQETVFPRFETIEFIFGRRVSEPAHIVHTSNPSDPRFK